MNFFDEMCKELDDIWEEHQRSIRRYWANVELIKSLVKRLKKEVEQEQGQDEENQVKS